MGHVIIGLPAHTLSITEFHPQCVRNPPTASCSRIKTCGAHPLITSPFSSPTHPFPSPSFTTHKKLLPHDSNPAAISRTCASEKNEMPIQTVPCALTAASQRFIRAVSVAEGDGAHVPCPLVDRALVVVNISRLEFPEAIHDDPEARTLLLGRVFHVFAGGILPSQIVWQLQFGHPHGVRESRDHEFVRVWRVPDQAVIHAERKESGSVKNEPRDPKIGRYLVGPREEKVGDEAVGRVLSQDELDRVPEEPECFDELGGHVWGCDGGEALAAVREAGLWARKWDFDDVDV
ncbi:eukaryotic translation initiation factor 3subunit K [Striga asiatica]|uniref:Eukaryotic translation initiation factor 3subunit K n=1 Tax=Striga asiatica TaxID=4170 RepID=A0A5A7QIT3_STRAF|nr:eukaryotic translation initiation factor 3subunit K [Striga asiatica]